MVGFGVPQCFAHDEGIVRSCFFLGGDACGGGGGGGVGGVGGFRRFDVDRGRVVCRIAESWSGYAPSPGLVVEFIGVRGSRVPRCFACGGKQAMESGQFSSSGISGVCGWDFAVLVVVEAGLAVE